MRSADVRGPRSGRGAARPLPILIGGLGVLVVILLVATVVFHPGSSHNSGDQPLSVAAGPTPGVDAASYITSRQQALAQLTTPAWAIVSFRSYQTPAGARRAVAPAEVGALLVAAPGTFPATVGPSDADAAGWASATRARAVSDAAGLRQMLPTANDPNTVAEFQSDLARLAVAARADGRGAIVFGVLVHADASVLRQLAGLATVRLVDVVGPPEPPLSGVAGLRPEESTAGTPPTRPT